MAAKKKNYSLFYFFSVVTLGVILGVVGADVISADSFARYIPWAVAGFLIGYLINDKRSLKKIGAIYGFSLPISFTVTGLEHDAFSNSLLSYFPFIFILGLIGILTSVFLAYLGSIVGSKTRK